MPLPLEGWPFDNLAVLIRLLEALPEEYADGDLLAAVREEINRRLNPHADDAG